VDSFWSLHFRPEQEPESIFRFEPEQEPDPESTLKVCAGAKPNFKGPISVVMLVGVKQNGIETCFLTSVVINHQSVTLGGSTEHFTIMTNDGFKGMAYAK